MDRNEYSLDQYTITKQVTKKLEDYNAAKSLPHIKVATRLAAQGDSSIKPQCYIPYIICNNKKDTSGAKLGLADKAYHLKEVSKDSDLIPDVNWYKENQILSSVSRLCKHIKEIDMYQLAECLGIDSNKYENMNKEPNDIDLLSNTKQNAYIISTSKNPLVIKCPVCKEDKKISNCTNSLKQNLHNFLYCSKCKSNIENKSLFNQVVSYIKKIINQFHSKERKCSKCSFTTRNLLLAKCSESDCFGGQLKYQYEESDLANDLNLIAKIFESSQNKNEENNDVLNKMLKGDLNDIVNYTSMMKSRIEYNTVSMRDLFMNISI